MDLNRLQPQSQSLFIVLNECLELLQKDILRLKCARDTRSIRKWNAVLGCAVACKKIIQAMEDNAFDTMDADLHTCRIACKRCVLYCYTSIVFSNSYRAANKILSQLLLHADQS